MLYFAPLRYPLIWAFVALLAKANPIPAPNGTVLTLSPPICVNGGEFPDWAGGPGSIVVNDCTKAMGLLVQRVQENLYSYYDFYSSPFLPAPFNGYPLPQGAGYGRCFLPHDLH